jgi:SAM-dependent methyltransferase
LFVQFHFRFRDTMILKENQVRQFYESFPCGGEGQEADERARLLPWWTQTLAFEEARGRVLEVACGTGLDLALLAANASVAWGVDAAERPLRVAQRRMVDRPGVGVAVADAAELPFRDASFDGLWCIGALHHMPRWRQAIAEFARVLVPGAHMHVLVYRRAALQSLLFFAGRVVRPIARVLLRPKGQTSSHLAAAAEFTLLPVVHLFPDRRWLDAITLTGLKIEAIERRDPWFPLDRLIPALRASRRGGHRFGRFLVVHAVKSGTELSSDQDR